MTQVYSLGYKINRKFFLLCNLERKGASKNQMEFEDDRYYIDKVLAGNISAFAFLVEKHKNVAFTIANKIVRNREDAEEVTQDAFLKIYQSLATFKGDAKFKTWLYRIVYNTAISKTRKKTFEWSPLDDYTTDNFTEDEIRENVDKLNDDEQIELMNKVINRLPEEESLLLTLFYKNDNSIEEITEITGLSTSNVKVKLHRLRKKLYDEMNTLQFKEMVEI